MTWPAGGADPLERRARLGTEGYWHVENVPIPTAGGWHVRTEARTLFQKTMLEDDFDVPPQ